MTMMICPKCKFEQPKDQFCAKCGVNVDSFKPSVALGAGLSSLAKPVLFILVIVGVIFFLFKNVVQDGIVPPELEIEQTTQIGSGAGSLKGSGRVAPQAAVPQAEVAQNPNLSAVATRSAPATAKTAESTGPKFSQVEINFSVGEHSGLEQLELADAKPNQTWHLVPSVNPIYTSATEEMTLKTGNNTFEYADQLIVYDLNFFIEEITDKDVKIKLNMKRTLRAQAQDGSSSYSLSLNERIPLDQTLIIIDALPRRASIDRPDSILSTLYKSQLFLSRASEFVQIIKFENPSNSPQE